ncbi:general substrate transporter [Auriscalpium vulgare]|uniref:General substrate transporter n=1 Tax=Auriscalpium vulgare TaxID=40419 RepID=A0ACB8R3P1_9AGAM|nr:general substrate transporter [Auriscalpium vulgare]
MSVSWANIFRNSRVYWLAFIAYWGIVLFGYDTGVAGGVVNSTYFQIKFGIRPATGPINQGKIDSVSSNVVSVLQAGAFFGALISAPVSAYIGRRWTLEAFTVIFSVGAVLQTIAGGSRGLGYIYGGRVISGFGIGGISAVAPAYVSECSPKNVRGRITGLFQIMVAIGVMISYFINFGISEHIKNSPKIWRIPFGFQLVPAGIMAFGLLTVKESPRWLASKGRMEDALHNLAYLRKEHPDSDEVRAELTEIEAAIREEREARANLGLREAFFGKGNFIRFVIAFVVFFLQQWGGQNSVNYYTPQIFTSIGYTGATNSLLASGVYGIVKVIATSIFIFFFVDSLGRRLSFFISALGMGTMFFIVGALLKTHPPNTAPGATPAASSKAMAAMIYIYVCFYSMGWGPLPWVYVSDIFPTRTRHYGLAVASSSQWLWNFVVAKVTPTIHTHLGYKMFLMFATINIGAMATFALLIPETKGRSLEEMDIIFGSITAEKRAENIERQERQNAYDKNETTSVRSLDQKV